MEIETENPEHPVAEQSKWLVTSALLHGLGIAIAALMTVVIEIPSDDKPLVLMSDISDRTEQSQITESLEIKNEFAHQAVEIEPLDANLLVTATVEQLTEVAYEVEQEFAAVTSDREVQEDIAQSCVNDPRQEGPRGFDHSIEDTENLIGPGTGIAGPWDATRFRSQDHGKGNPFPTRMALHRLESRCYFRRISCCGGRGEVSSLSWLARHQEEDGSWDARKHEAGVKSDTAVTALALLALLGAGHTERVGEYKSNVRKAVAWLKSKQDADGMIWDTTDDAASHRAKGYPCAIASLAMIEAAGMANIPETRAAAQKALDYICHIHQGSDGGWRYGPKSSGDLSVSGWYVMALKSAKVCGFTVPPKSLESAIDFVDQMEIKEPAVGNAAAYSRFKYSATSEHVESGYRLAAIGTVMRQFTGTRSEELCGTAEWFVEKGGLPTYGANGANVDLYYWYYGTLAVFQQSSRQPELWTKWNEALRATLMSNQCKLGDDHGSWAPVGAYANEWGRVGQTALSTLCIETWYRYKQLQN